MGITCLKNEELVLVSGEMFDCMGTKSFIPFALVSWKSFASLVGNGQKKKSKAGRGMNCT